MNQKGKAANKNLLPIFPLLQIHLPCVSKVKRDKAKLSHNVIK